MTENISEIALSHHRSIYASRTRKLLVLPLSVARLGPATTAGAKTAAGATSISAESGLRHFGNSEEYYREGRRALTFAWIQGKLVPQNPSSFRQPLTDLVRALDTPTCGGQPSRLTAPSRTEQHPAEPNSKGLHCAHYLRKPLRRKKVPSRQLLAHRPGKPLHDAILP